MSSKERKGITMYYWYAVLFKTGWKLYNYETVRRFKYCKTVGVNNRAQIEYITKKDIRRGYKL
jgi:hypothetical protein